jgi:hypothetical protein
MQSCEPRIIARGEWTQDENGDTTYYPAHRRPQTFRHEAEAVTGWGDLDHGRETNALQPDAPRSETPRSGYRIRSDAVWAEAREAFLAGETAQAVCDRYDLNLHTFKTRAAREGWRRSDQPDPEPFDPETEPPVEDGDLEALAGQALIRARRAVGAGQSAEAARWLRVHAQLTRLIAGLAPAEPPAAPKPPRAPDPMQLLAIRMRTVGEIARAAAGLDPDNEPGHAALSELMAGLRTLPTGLPEADADIDADMHDDVDAPPDPEPEAAETPQPPPPPAPVSDHSHPSDPIFIADADDRPPAPFP